MGSVSARTSFRLQATSGAAVRAVTLFLMAVFFLLAFTQDAGAISRDTIISRAQRWVDLGIPYSQTSRFEGYRQDCSGFVSMAWVLPTPGRTTRDLAQVCVPITKDQLQPGDILLKPGSHVAIFAGWVDPERTRWRSLEQSNSRGGAVSRVIVYPFWNETGYSPFRYLGVDDDFLDVIEPVWGLCRYETAIRASWNAFPARGSARDVLLATGETWPDALGGASLAGVLDAPMLLTRANTLPVGVRDEIVRLGATRVFVLGGEGAISPEVMNAVDSISGVSAERIGGADRYETANQIALRTALELQNAGRALPTAAYLATGENFPDALSVSPVAYATEQPILLTRPSSADTATLEVLGGLPLTEVFVIGGDGVVASSVATQVAAVAPRVTRISGADRYATSLAVAAHGESLGLRWSGLGVAAGTTFPDALAGGAAQGRLGSLLVLTPPHAIDEGVESAIRARRAQIGKVRVYGGPGAVSDAPRARIAHAMRGTR